MIILLVRIIKEKLIVSIKAKLALLDSIYLIFYSSKNKMKIKKYTTLSEQFENIKTNRRNSD